MNLENVPSRKLDLIENLKLIIIHLIDIEDMSEEPPVCHNQTICMLCLSNSFR